MKCEVCGRSVVTENITLYRVNPKGVVPAVWRCKECYDAPGLSPAIDPVVRDITDLITERNRSVLDHD